MNHHAAVFALVEGEQDIDDIGFRIIASFDPVMPEASRAVSGVQHLSLVNSAAAAAPQPAFQARQQDELSVDAVGGGRPAGRWRGKRICGLHACPPFGSRATVAMVAWGSAG